TGRYHELPAPGRIGKQALQNGELRCVRYAGIPTSARSFVADPTETRPPQPRPLGVPVGEPYGTAPPELGRPRRARNPVPSPPGTPRMLRMELGLVLLLAFAPGILGLLIIALGPQGSAEVEAQLLPSVVSIV